jgi:hypothetical protein
MALFILGALGASSHAQCPAAPSSLGASGACDGVMIQWSGVAPGTQSINIYRSTTNNSGSAALLTNQPGLSAGSFTDSSAVAGQPYFYFLAAVTTPSGACPSGVGSLSPSVTATRSSAIVATPANLNANNPTCSPVNLSWSSVSGAESYAVYSSTTPTLGANPTPIGIVNSTSTAVSLPPGAVGNAYYFVAAANSCGLGPIAGPVSVSLAGAPSAVTNITVVGVNSCNGAQVTWNASDRAQKYTILGALNEGSFTTLGMVDAPATSFTHTPGAGQRRWRYSVIASNGCGQSPLQEFGQIDLSAPISVVNAPSSIAVNAGQMLVLNAKVENASSLRWRRDGVDVINGPGISGATTNQLTITRATPALAGVYTLSATPCAGSMLNTPGAVVGVRQLCAADFDSSGAVNLDDVFIYLNAFFAGCP